MRGKRRLHKRPNSYEIKRCRWWLERELALVDPRLVVALGATAAQVLLGRSVRIGRERDTIAKSADGREVFSTTHPSAILRVRHRKAREEAFRLLTEELLHARNRVTGGRELPQHEPQNLILGTQRQRVGLH